MGTSANDLKALLYRITEEIWNKGDLELIDEVIAENLIDNIIMPGFEGSGREGYRASAVQMRTAFPDYHESVDFAVAEGDIVVSFARITGTQTGELYGMPPSGRRIELPTIGALRIKDGRVFERWGVGDSLLMMQQLGFIPSG
jgi:predicted ester cyclase